MSTTTQRIRHLGGMVDSEGLVSARCFSPPRAIGPGETWTTDEAAVTCAACVEAMAGRSGAAAPALEEGGPLVLPDRETWLKWRHGHIGGSDVAAICGVNKRMSPLQLWAEKTQKLAHEEADEDENEPAFWGRELEPTVANVYERRARAAGRNVTLINPGPFTVRVSERLPFLSATLDREINDADRGAMGVFEAKTASAWLAGEWARDEVPERALLQVQHGIMVTGWAFGAVAGLVGGQRFVTFEIEPMPELIALMVERCEWFWDLVQRDIPPPPDASDSAAETWKRLHPKDNGEKVKLGGEIAALVAEWDALDVAIKATEGLEDRRKEIKALIKAAIGDASYGVLPSGAELSLTTSSNPGSVVAPFSYRTLRRLKLKPHVAKKGRK